LNQAIRCIAQCWHCHRNEIVGVYQRLGAGGVLNRLSQSPATNAGDIHAHVVTETLARKYAGLSSRNPHAP
jgi:hypothetical protein